MQVILLERVGKIGNLGDVVNVKPGFARNFLLPQGKALRANDANMQAFEARRAELEAENASKKTEAEALGGKVDGGSHVIIRAASDAGALYGSVTPRDITEAIAVAGHEVERNAITLDQPIKALGLYDVNVVLHPEVIVAIKVNVARSEEEAELQAQGKTIQSAAADAEAEAEADLAALLDDVGAAGADGDDDDDAEGDGDN